MDVVTLHSLVKSRSLHLGAVIEIFLTNKADMGESRLHPEAHVNDGFEIDESKIGALDLTPGIAEPHKTAKAALEQHIAKGGGDPLVTSKLKTELADADAAKNAMIVKFKASKALAHSRDSHIDPGVYKDIGDPTKNPDKAFGFDAKRLPDFEAHEKVRKDEASLPLLWADVEATGHKNKAAPPAKNGNKDYKAQNDAFQKYKSVRDKIPVNKNNLASGESGSGYIKRGAGAKNTSHAMFADSESALMALFAALNTEAGEQALFSLMGAVSSPTNVPLVAVHSYSAPAYLTAKALKGKTPPTSAHSGRGAASTPGAKIPMIERAGNKNTGVLEGHTPADIRFVTVVFIKEGTDALLLTCHPVAPGKDKVASGFTAGLADVVELANRTVVGVPIEVPKGDWLTPSPSTASHPMPV